MPVSGADGNGMRTVATRLPVTFDVRTLLEELFGRPVLVEPGAPWSPAGREATVALYVDDRREVRAVGVYDLRLSAYAGAAIGLLPATAAEAAAADGRLDQVTRANLDEVLAVCGSLFDGAGGPPVRLDQVIGPGEEVPPAVQALTAVLDSRLDLRVEITGYGRGRMSLLGVG